MNTCYVYILASRNNRHLCVRATADLKHGVRHQRLNIARQLGRKNVFQKVVHVETFEGLSPAVERERQLKGWSRTRLRDLVSRRNPTWKPVSIRRFLARLARRLAV